MQLMVSFEMHVDIQCELVRVCLDSEWLLGKVPTER